MMRHSIFKVRKSELEGEICVPPSKSHTLRAILFGALGNGKTTIYHPLPSPDTQAMIHACRLFGATCEKIEERLEIQGVNGQIRYAEDVIHAGNSGIVLRFCSAIGALSSHPIVITGDHSIRTQRPMFPLINGLQQLQVSAASMRGDSYAPVIIQGPFRGGQATIDGQDSQPVSALLIASAFAEGSVELRVRNPGEKPWVALTLHWLDRLGIPYEQHQFESYRLFGKARYSGFEYHVPGDMSSAAFPIAAALVTQSELTLKNVDMNDVQGDKELITIFQKMGAIIEYDSQQKTLHVRKSPALSGIAVDVNPLIDAITILAVVACFAEGDTHLYNGAIAKQKECNRIQSIAAELRKMGAKISETEDGLIIKQSTLRGASVHSYHDHRMVMSLAVAAMGAEGETTITSVECTVKTFPSFAQEFHALGAKIIQEYV